MVVSSAAPAPLCSAACMIQGHCSVSHWIFINYHTTPAPRPHCTLCLHCSKMFTIYCILTMDIYKMSGEHNSYYCYPLHLSAHSQHSEMLVFWWTLMEVVLLTFYGVLNNQLEKLEAAKAAWLVCLSLLSLPWSIATTSKLISKSVTPWFGHTLKL